MSATASSRADPLLLAGWVIFASGNMILMYALPGKEAVPFHLIWVSMAIVYGIRPLPLRSTFVVGVVVAAVTGAAMIRHAANEVILWEEVAEVPLMPLLFFVMVWHVHRRTAAVAEAQRLSELQKKFVRFASHELRTPITIARGYTELMRKDYSGPQLTEDTDIVLDELDKLERISARLLTLAQIDRDRPDFAAVDIDALLHRTHRRWSAAAQREWCVRAEAGWTLADAERLETCLDSLLENAVRHTGPGGRIELVGRRTTREIVIEVLDDGVGVALADLPYIFESFVSGGPRAGTGLGLAIVKAAVDSHGGSVAAGHRPGGGLRIELRLPARGGSRPEQSRAEAGGWGGGPRPAHGRPAHGSDGRRVPGAGPMPRSERARELQGGEHHGRRAGHEVRQEVSNGDREEAALAEHDHG